MKVRSIWQTLLILYGFVVLAGCDLTSDDSTEEWFDYGTITGKESIGGVVLVDDEMVVATNDGLWRRSLNGNDTWQRTGLTGIQVNTLINVPDADSVLMAGTSPLGVEGVYSFYRSSDGGRTWTGYGEGLLDEFAGGYAVIEHLTVQPGTKGATVLANLSGPAVVQSSDRGTTWRVVQGSLDTFGYPCLLYIPTSDRNKVYQGCESPLDVAWIRKYDIPLGNQTLGDGDLLVDIDDISNRRINSFAGFSNRSGKVYAGVEGGVVELSGQDWRWFWKAGDGDSLYTYVKFIWVDPNDADHFIFGGGDGASDESSRAGLYETFDAGTTVKPLQSPFNVDFNTGGVRAGAGVEGESSVVFATLTEAGIRVLRKGGD